MVIADNWLIGGCIPRSQKTAGCIGLKTVTFVLPAYNEEDSLGVVIREIAEVMSKPPPSYALEILVVDNNSTDRTVWISQYFGASILKETEQGKGCAVRAAVPLIKSEYTVMADADGTYSLDKVPQMLDMLSDGYDVVTGWRRDLQKGSMSKHSAIGKGFIVPIVRARYGGSIHDVCTGLWAFKTRALQHLNLKSKHFTLELELYRECRRAKYIMGEVPIVYRPRYGGVAKFKASRDSWQAIKFIVTGRE